jgi:hypothetical protein
MVKLVASALNQFLKFLGDFVKDAHSRILAHPMPAGDTPAAL